MLDRKLIEMMYDTAVHSGHDGAREAALIYRKMLDMPMDSQMRVQFEEGETFIVTRRSGGYELA